MKTCVDDAGALETKVTVSVVVTYSITGPAARVEVSVERKVSEYTVAVAVLDGTGGSVVAI